jgi:hypothetical protein
MNFKKQISLFLAFFLLVSNLGLAFNVHYCDNEIASVSINTNSNFLEIEKDCCGKVEKESKCCKNKIIKSNEKSDQIVVKIFSVDANYNLVDHQWEPTVFDNTIHFKKRAIPAYYCNVNAPPLYLLYSQYTFYA